MHIKNSNRFIAGMAVALVLIANVSWAEAESKAHTLSARKQKGPTREPFHFLAVGQVLCGGCSAAILANFREFTSITVVLE